MAIDQLSGSEFFSDRAVAVNVEGYLKGFSVSPQVNNSRCADPMSNNLLMSEARRNKKNRRDKCSNAERHTLNNVYAELLGFLQMKFPAHFDNQISLLKSIVSSTVSATATWMSRS